MIFKFILDLIAPKKCYSCKKEWLFLCKKCYDKLYDFENVCYVCKGKTEKYNIHEKCKKETYFDKIIILKHYKQNWFDKHIKKAKFYWKKEIFEELWEFMYEKFLSNQKIFKLDDFLIISIPSHYSRKIKRWYNSSEVLALSFSKASKIKHINNLVIKTKNTKQQSKLSKKQRFTNLNNSFSFNKKYFNKLENKTVIIVDDIISTWSTLNEISKVLKNNWIKKNIWLIVASD